MSRKLRWSLFVVVLLLGAIMLVGVAQPAHASPSTTSTHTITQQRPTRCWWSHNTHYCQYCYTRIVGHRRGHGPRDGHGRGNHQPPNRHNPPRYGNTGHMPRH